MQVQARLLPYPTLTYADTSRKTDKSGQWHPAKFYQPGNMQSYAFASFTHPVTALNLQVRSDWGALLKHFSNVKPRGKLLQKAAGCWTASVAPAACLCLRRVLLRTQCCAAAPGRCPKLLYHCLPARVLLGKCEAALDTSLCPNHTAAAGTLDDA